MDSIVTVERAPVRTAMALTSLFLMAAVLSGCGGGAGSAYDSTAAASGAPAPSPSSGAPAPGPATVGVNDPNPPVLEQAPPPAPVSLPTGGAPAVAPVPTTQRVASGVDMSNPGVVIRPVTATSSAVQGNNTAALAIDGDATTRWESTHVDNAWIQFDFGAKTALGSMKLVWENAYGKEYSIQVSDDATNWSQLRYVADGKGGTEEFLNLSANVRYVRINGVKRATQYGFSLFEVSFKSPGSDNMLGSTVAASAFSFPADGTALAPTPAEKAPLETVQFTLPDGTLVTRFGMVGRSRHARERGEDWNEVGYGPNDTVDAA